MSALMSRTHRSAVLLGVFLLLPGCKGSSTPLVGNSCAGLANSYCAKLDECAPFLTIFFYGDRSSCSEFLGQECEISLAAPGSGLTSTVASACAREVNDFSCDQFLDIDAVATSCLPHGGAVRTGSPCGDDWQCASGRCLIPEGAGCGRCVDPVPEGGACTGIECAPGLDCAVDPATGSGACATAIPAGGPCDDMRPCGGGNLCQRQSANSPQSTCQPSHKAGESCESGVVVCDYLRNAQCNTGTNVCELPVATVQAGHPCGWISGDYVFCNGACTLDSPSAESGICVGLNPRIAEGRPCAPFEACELGTTCIDGLCSTRNPSICGK
jgi:hypothetical protein